MKRLNGSAQENSVEASANGRSVTTVLVAVAAAHVREALVAMLGALDGFRVVAEADTDERALEAARSQRPYLALIEPEMSECRGWWVIQQIQAEKLATVVVALGRRADAGLAQRAGAHTYVQMGTSPRDLLKALEAAIAVRASAGPNGSAGSGAEAEHDLLSDTHTVV